MSLENVEVGGRGWRCTHSRGETEWVGCASSADVPARPRHRFLSLVLRAVRWIRQGPPPTAHRTAPTSGCPAPGADLNLGARRSEGILPWLAIFAKSKPGRAGGIADQTPSRSHLVRVAQHPSSTADDDPHTTSETVIHHVRTLPTAARRGTLRTWNTSMT